MEIPLCICQEICRTPTNMACGVFCHTHPYVAKIALALLAITFIAVGILGAMSVINLDLYSIASCFALGTGALVALCFVSCVQHKFSPDSTD